MSRPRITWELHGDLRVMKANGWIVSIIWYEGGWWTAGPFAVTPSTGLRFHTRIADARKAAIEAYREAFDPRRDGGGK